MTNSDADKSREVIKVEAQRNSALRLQRSTNWLSSTDMDATLHDIISRIQEGTGAALFSDPTFHSWSTGNFQNLLCLGNAGVGKTVLAAQVIDNFIRNHRHKHSPVLFFFASWQHREIESQKPTAILANLLRQLLLWKGSILDETQQLFERHMKGTSRPDEPALLACLEREAGNFSDICIIIDALDELSEECRPALLDCMHNLQLRRRILFMATSREQPKTVKLFNRFFPDFQSIQIKSKPEDIEAYLLGQMSRLPDFVMQNIEVQELIKSEVMKRSDGM